jgi:cell division transport system permease protein
MTLVLFLLGAIGFVMKNIFSISEGMRESVTMIVELKENISEDTNNEIATMLSDNKLVSSFTYVSKEEKLDDKEFRRAFNVNIEGILDDNPLPNSYDVILSSMSADSTALATFADEVRSHKGVDRVTYPQDFVKEMHSTLDVINLIMVAFGAVLLAISFILLNNTVRLAVYSHREMINTLKAVGATKWFIMKPFIGRSALQGVLAGILASALLVGALYGLDHFIPGLGIIPTSKEIGIYTGAMAALGVVVAVICTLPIVNRFANMKSNKIHLC